MLRLADEAPAAGLTARFGMSMSHIANHQSVGDGARQGPPTRSRARFERSRVCVGNRSAPAAHGAKPIAALNPIATL